MRHYDTTTIPAMSTGATDMANLRARGIQCYGIGPATDTEDVAKGFAMHGDQERLLESELYVSFDSIGMWYSISHARNRRSCLVAVDRHRCP